MNVNNFESLYYDTMNQPFIPFGDSEFGSLSFSFDDFFELLRESVVGQDEELEKIAYDIYSYLQAVVAGKTIPKHNIVIAGPSASGKTELYRALREILKSHECFVPVLHTDATAFSPTGYQGREVSEIFKEISQKGSSGAAIVFIDEFDKILFPQLASGGANANAVLQSDFLALIEGGTRSDTNKTIDTSNTMFIALGAFTDFRREAVSPKTMPTIGFLAQSKNEQKSLVKASGDAYRLTMEDLIRAGGGTELIGRFDELYNFKRISRENFPLLFEKLARDTMKKQQILIRYTEETEDAFYSLAISEFGCREINRVLYRTIKPCLITLAREGCLREQWCIEVSGIERAVPVKI